MSYENIIFEKAGNIAMITLNRPERLNALHRAMAEECEAALIDCAQDEAIRVVLITGAGRAFCAGGDLKAMRERLGQDPSRFFREDLAAINRMVLAICRLPKPVIAVVNGHAAGAGFNLVLACDLCIASTEAQFRQAFAGLGLVPDAGGTFFLPRLLGLRRAMQLVFLDEALSAQQAEAWGLINRVAPADKLMDEAWAWAEKLAEGPTAAFGHAKMLIQQGAMRDLERQLEGELLAQVECSVTADFREGLTAFLEKRSPRFVGK